MPPLYVIVWPQTFRDRRNRCHAWLAAPAVNHGTSPPFEKAVPSRSRFAGVILAESWC